MPQAMWTLLVALALALSFGCARPTGSPSRPWYGGAGLGGYAAVTGPARSGLLAVTELGPGGPFDRAGIRAEAASLGSEVDRDGRFTLGLTYLAAAARPRLTVAIHGEGGLVTGHTRPLAGGGVTTQLWLVGPFAVAVDSAAHLVVDGLDSALWLSASLSLRLAR